MKKLFLAVVAMMVSATTFAQNEVGQLTISLRLVSTSPTSQIPTTLIPVLVWLPVQNLSME